MPNNKTIGTLGEKTAASYLKSQGYKILDRNFFLRASGGPKIAEVDIVAQKSGILSFVEVKTIKENSKYLAQDKVNEVKKWKIAKAAEMWMIKRKIPLNVKWQIDVIAVELLGDTRPKIFQKLFGHKYKLSHFKNVSRY